jgi:hypothetical protein
MAPLAGNRIAWLYTSDSGTVYRVAAQKALTDQAVLGGAAATGSETEKPSAIKLRRVTVSNTAGQSRVLVCYTPGAPIATPGTAVNANYDGNSVAFTSNGGFIPQGGPRRNVTKQTA